MSGLPLLPAGPIPAIASGGAEWMLFGDRAWSVTIPGIGLTLTGRAVLLACVTLAVLALSGAAVALAHKAELRERWMTWAIIVPVVGLPIWAGKGTTALLAAALSAQATRELARLARLPRAETLLLLLLAVAYPVSAWLSPSLLALAPVMVLVCALPAVLQGDSADGLRRASITGFASVWICWSLAHLVVLWHDAFLIAFAAAAADVAAWCGGTGLRRFAWARRPLSPLSPNKTVGGLAGALTGTVVVLALLGALSLGAVVAIGVGGVLGDLLESLIKRTAGVKDAGDWLPGFGGLLDRVDSLLLVLPLAAVLA
ncbi:MULTISPECIES: phosphatidate cytidylyltransferase [Actinomyces]|uniref:Phosphatidate cytidylyltransferase n=1 Tax=Actinomyces marmotae TaxID=2737173 RepID=A0A6M8B710_9ACTO|nr:MULTISPECIES: phosphatidate cytidylyltransferase [Actinomyces]QKD79856.1 phosphatidate cytidylyltransferase [Actinomyces marmotae]